MKEIRPYQLFNLLATPANARRAEIKIPNRRDLALLETLLLVTAVRIVKAKRIFEFGTFFGSTTLNLALNSPPDAQIFTFDLGTEEAANAQQLAADAILTREHLERPAMDFEGSEVEDKILRFIGDSRTFDFSRWHDSIDFVFIDGGHDRPTVQSDTENALKMIRKDALAAIFWHDYGHPEYPENTAYLDELAARLPSMFHVGDTILCGWFRGDVLGTKKPEPVGSGS